MSISVNPPPLRKLPAKLLNDRELAPFFLDQQEIIFKTWLRSGGGVDLISNQQDAIDAIELRLDALESRVTYLEGLTIVTAVGLTIDNTVTGHQTIVCTAAITVKLDATPNDRDTAKIKVGQKKTQVIIDGNGKLIEADTTMKLRSLNTKRQIGMDLEYSSSLDRWFTT